MEGFHRAASCAITGCLSSSPIPLLFSEASLTPLQVTLINYAQSSYERALRLPTFFSISDLARLGVKPRLCRSCSRGFASTRPLMLPSTSREALSPCLPSLSSLESAFLHCGVHRFLFMLPPRFPSLTVSSSCSRSDHPLSRRGAALAHLDSLPPHDLVLWTDGSFPIGKGGSGVLANCSVCGTEATLSFSAGSVCYSFSADAHAILQALLASAAQISLSFLFCSSLTLALSSPLFLFLHLSSYLNLSGRSYRKCLLSPPVLSGCNGFPHIRFFRRTMRMMSWPERVRATRALCNSLSLSSYLMYPLFSFLGLEAYCLI